jgi:hypothetical membrane protein
MPFVVFELQMFSVGDYIVSSNLMSNKDVGFCTVSNIFIQACNSWICRVLFILYTESGKLGIAIKERIVIMVVNLWVP